MAEPPVTFASLLRKLRAEARLTQEELAEASGVRPRSISDLERGVAMSPQRDTIRRLADALGLAGLVRAQFEAVARGRAVPAATEAAGAGGAAAATRTLPRDVASFTGRQQELQELVTRRPCGGCGRRGGHPRDRRDGRGRQDRVRGARRAPAGGPVPGRADLPAAARAHPRAAAGRPGRRAGQPAADRRGPGRADPAGPGGADGAVAGPAGRAAAAAGARRRGQQRAGPPLLPGAGGSLVLVTSRRHLSALEDATAVSLDTLPPERGGRAAGPARRPGPG